MPKLSGVDVCRRIKQENVTRLTPVILVSAVDGVADRIAGLAAGADDFLSKPVNPAELLTRVGAGAGVARSRRRVHLADRRRQASCLRLLSPNHNSWPREGHDLADVRLQT